MWMRLKSKIELGLVVKVEMSKKLQVVLHSYLYAGLAAALALVANGETDYKLILKAALAAVLGPVAQALNPKDSSLGVGSNK